MRRRDQIFLPARQRVLVLISSLTATTAAALLLRLAILHLERLYFDEVDVAGGFAAGVTRLRIVGNKIPGLQVEFFEEEVCAPSVNAPIRASTLKIHFLFLSPLTEKCRSIATTP
jgi:hypothetical protein